MFVFFLAYARNRIQLCLIYEAHSSHLYTYNIHFDLILNFNILRSVPEKTHKVRTFISHLLTYFLAPTKCSGCAEWVHEQAAGAVAYFSLSPHLVAQPPTWVALAPFLVQAGSQAAPTASRLSGKRWGKLARWPRTSQALQLTRKVVNLKQNTNLDKAKMKAK